MKQIEEYHWERSESAVLYGKLYIPDGTLKILVIVVHGIGEHSVCYDDWAEKFVSQSVGVLTFDLRGHGRSSGRRGHVSIEIIKNDLRFMIGIMQEKFPNTPVVLFGHSMGGHIVLSYAVGGDVKVQGIIASSPWLKLVNPPSPVLVRLAKWTSPVMPWLTVRTGIKSGQLVRDDAGVKSSKTDPLLHKKISVKLFSDLWTNSEAILRSKRLVKIPLLLMHGDDDSLTSCQASEFFAQNAGRYVTFRKWRGMRHHLLNETDNEMVFRYVMKWLSEKMIQTWNSSEPS